MKLHFFLLLQAITDNSKQYFGFIQFPQILKDANPNVYYFHSIIKMKTAET